MTADSDNKMVDVYDKVEGLETNYLREIISLSKIFITLSIAMLGLSMTKAGPNISSASGTIWILSTWLCLIFSAILGFMGIFFFSRRFKNKADYLQNSYYVDVALQLENTEDKFEQFMGKSRIAKDRFDQQYKRCVLSILCQALLLLVAFGLFGIHIWFYA